MEKNSGDKIQLVIKGEIKTKQRPRATIVGGHARVYPPKDTVYYENYIKAMYQEKYPDFSFKNKPIVLSVTCYFKANQEMQKVVTEAEIEEIPCKIKKDVDNIAKVVMDALNGIAFNDDRQITILFATKKYTLEQERIDIVIRDCSLNYRYRSLEELKDERKYNELLTKINQLQAKPKLNKAESQRLENLSKNLRDLAIKFEKGDESYD